MDELEYYELELLLENYCFAYQNEWEIGRMISYNIMKPNLKKQYQNKKITELLPLMSDTVDYNSAEVEEDKHILTDEDKNKIRIMSEFVQNRDMKYKNIEEI